MPLTIVRNISTRRFVGLYAARVLDELALLVDETCAPCDCEFAHMPSGGLAVTVGAPTVPFIADKECQVDLVEAMPGLIPTAELMTAFCDSSIAWTSLDPENLCAGSIIETLLRTLGGRERLEPAQALSARRGWPCGQ